MPATWAVAVLVVSAEAVTHSDTSAPAMSLVELVDAIHARSLTLTYDPWADRLHVSAPEGETIPAAISEAGRAHRVWLVHIITGRSSGLALAPCTVCGEPTMTAAYRTTKWPHCRFTPRCPGHHEPRPIDLIGVAEVKALRIKRAPKYEPSTFLLGPVLPYPGSDDQTET